MLATLATLALAVLALGAYGYARHVEHDRDRIREDRDDWRSAMAAAAADPGRFAAASISALARTAPEPIRRLMVEETAARIIRGATIAATLEGNANGQQMLADLAEACPPPEHMHQIAAEHDLTRRLDALYNEPAYGSDEGGDDQ